MGVKFLRRAIRIMDAGEIYVGESSVGKNSGKAGALLAGVLVFTVLLAAIPAHRAPAAPLTVLQDAARSVQQQRGT